jgi:hypothetical protein
LLAAKINLRPCEQSEISETLPGVKAELDQTLPFRAGDIENGAKLINREWPPFRGCPPLDSLHSFRRILQQKAIKSRGTKDSPDDFEVSIGGICRSLCRKRRERRRSSSGISWYGLNRSRHEERLRGTPGLLRSKPPSSLTKEKAERKVRVA